MIFQGGSMVFHGFGLVSMVFKLVSWFFMVFGRFPWFFEVVSWYFMVFGWFPWFPRWFHGFSWFLLDLNGFSR